MPPADYDELIEWANEILDQPVGTYSDQDIATALKIPLDELPAARRAMRERMIEQLTSWGRMLEPRAQAGNKKAADLMRQINEQKHTLRAATHY
jgi:hypothetical protein